MNKILHTDSDGSKLMVSVDLTATHYFIAVLTCSDTDKFSAVGFTVSDLRAIAQQLNDLADEVEGDE